MRIVSFPLVWLTLISAVSATAWAQEAGRDIYMKRCFWCHGEEGRGDGASAEGMFPRPRDFVVADYLIRSTPHGQLPTDEDLFGVISRGLPGTPMPGWEKILTEKELRSLVDYLKSLSPRFNMETPQALQVPSANEGSAERGKELYRKAKCFLCHGEAGRGDGAITTTLNFAWGMPHTARDFTRGWTFKGGHEPRDIYLRITGGLNGTPMGPYQDLLTDQERWDLAHYVASLDREPTETSEDFMVVAGLIDGEIPDSPDSPVWEAVAPIIVPLAGQIVLDPPLHWWIPTSGSVAVRSLWNGAEVAFLLEWNDPTGPDDAGAGSAAQAEVRSSSSGSPPGSFPDSAFLQFAAKEGGKPYFLFGDDDNPVKVWHWQAHGPRLESRSSDTVEEWNATGTGKIDVHPAPFRVTSAWKEGRWQVIFRGPLDGEPTFQMGKFVPILFSVRDGANGEIDDVRAISTWIYTTLERPESIRPWLVGLAFAFGAVIGEMWLLRRLRA